MGSFLLFGVGLVIVGFGLANESIVFVALGLVAIALPILRWFRVRRENDGTWTFEGALEKPPDSATAPEPEQEDERERRRSP